MDNGSTDDSVAAIRKSDSTLQIIETGENLGFAEGNNVGIKAALEQGASHLLLLNNDTLVDPDLIEAFLEQNDPIMGGKIYLESDRKRLDHIGGIWQPKKAGFNLIGARALDEGQFEKPMDLDYACGACLFFQREVLETVGLLEKKFFLFWEESDLCFRAKKMGYTTTFCPKAKIYHKVSASFSGKAHTHYFFWRNRWLFVERNFSGDVRKKAKRQIGRELLHIGKLYLIKSLLRRSDKNLKEYRSALLGSYHYFRKRFGNAPPQVFK